MRRIIIFVTLTFVSLVYASGRPAPPGGAAQKARGRVMVKRLPDKLEGVILNLPIQAFSGYRPSSPPPTASRQPVTQVAARITRDFPPCRFFTQEALQNVMGSRVKSLFPMLVRLHNPDGQFKFANPTSTAAKCSDSSVNFKADGTFSRPGLSLKRSVGFTVYSKVTVTYYPKVPTRPAIVDSATLCFSLIKVHDTDIMREMKDAARMQFDNSVRNQASCRDIKVVVRAYVQKGGVL